MTRRFVDLSIYLENDVITDPPFMRPAITYKKHLETMPATWVSPAIPAEGQMLVFTRYGASLRLTAAVREGLLEVPVGGGVGFGHA